MRRTYFTKALATALLTCAAATANAQYDYYVAESSHGVCYKADKVVLNVGASGVDINMKLLGETSDECQIWYCRNTTGKHTFSVLSVDDGFTLGFDRTTPESGGHSVLPPLLPRPTNAAQDSTATDNANQDSTSTDNSGGALLGNSDIGSDIIWAHSDRKANLRDGSNYIHLVKVIGQTFLFYKCYDENTGQMRDLHHTDPITADGFYIEPRISITASEPIYIESANRYAQYVKWNIEGITNEMLDHAVLQESFDGGKSWISERWISKLSDSTLVRFPWSSNGQAMYQIQLFPKSNFNYLANCEYWESKVLTSTNLCMTDIPCTMSIAYGKDNYADNDDYAKRTYSAKVTWAMPYNFNGRVASTRIECRPYGSGDNWQTLANLKGYTGTETVQMPVGYDSVQLRMVAEAYPDFVQIKRTNTSDVALATMAFKPEFSGMLVKDSVYDATANTLNVTLRYMMNDDLWQTRSGAADVYYSTDGGNKWTQAATIQSPTQLGTVQVSVPGGAKEYKFRMGIVSIVNNEPSYCAKTANHDASGFDGSSSIDNASINGQQPVRVYNLSGAFLGNTTDGLPTGVYIVNGKKYVVK